MKNVFDVIVIGAGHAGCEAALACARLGKDTLVLATSLDTVGFLACNPSIGGTAKGNIVKEIDAMGGQMALVADKTLIQLRMLNRGKGPAVFSPRAQVDKHEYHFEMKKVLENTPRLFLRQGEAVSVEKHEEMFCVDTAQGLSYQARAVVVACGVYLNSKIIIGKYEKFVGPNGFAAATQLTASLEKLGFEIRRFKTGTPARINLRSIDLSKVEVQGGEDDMAPFSALSKDVNAKEVDCFLTYSNLATHEVIKDNIAHAPLYSGSIKGIGPRYCPSIEDKVMRFADKQRHQIFLEREGRNTNEVYVQGVSSSMPAWVQQQIYCSIAGLEEVEIMRDAYAIEYDCINPMQLYPSLMFKKVEGLFTAGQINGTSGYEEAAAQGLVAGVNACRFVNGQSPFVLTRENSYIGVLIDDITTKGTNEPYRMMTSRAEHRLHLRQDNADSRLTELGKEIGLATEQRWQVFCEKRNQMAQICEQLKIRKKVDEFSSFFHSKNESINADSMTLEEMLRRTSISIFDLEREYGVFCGTSKQAKEQVEVEIKYQGYIQKQQLHIDSAKKLEDKLLPSDINYDAIEGLRIEARQKLSQTRPLNIGQATRISGVSPADITVLIIYLTLKQQVGS